jgi:PTS system nitrogen regulatory IIA component
MTQLARLLSPSNVQLNLPASSKKRLFEHAALMFENHQGMERGRVFDALFARERLGSTGLGDGVAIPHGRIKGLREATAGVIRCVEPIPFDAPDGLPVRLLVFLLVPEPSTEPPLTLLSELAELMSDASVRESLMTLDDPLQVHHLLSAWEPQPPAA